MNTAINNNVLSTADALANELASIRAEKNLLKKREEEVLARLLSEGVVDMESFEKETAVLDTTIITKIPTLKAPRYDVAKTRVLAKALNISTKKLVKREWKFTVDENALAELVESGLAPQALIDTLKIQYNKIAVKKR
jgi:hypothetical protein